MIKARTTRVGLMISLACCVLPGLSLGQQPAADDEAGGAVEEVVVLGSRLIRSNMDSPAPVTTIDADELLAAGITTVAEFVRYLPQNTDVLSDAKSGLSSVRGSAAINLRGLGVDATLVLLNGRRIAPYGASGAASPFVDVNAIPVAALERIEVLKDGASAIYGSEAVGGVVNFVTRKHLQGFVAEGGYMTTREGDGDEWDINLAGGWSSAASNFVGTLSYFERELIWARDRDFSADVDLTAAGGRNARSTFSSPPTIDLLQTGARLADPECPDDSPVNSRTVVVPGVVEFCRFNYAWYQTLQQPSEKLGLTAFFEHAFDAGMTLFAEGLFSRSDTTSYAAPTPMVNYYVPPYHPDNPFGEDLLIRARAVDTGTRGFQTVSTTWRVVAGLRGEVSGWDWEAALTASEAESEDSRINGVLVDAYQDALLGLGGPGADRFYNPFGLAPDNPPEVIEQMVISGTGTRETNSELTADLQFSRNFGRLPGGPVGVAAGLQARTQELDQFADEEEVTGVIAGSSGLRPIGGERDIYSAFAELLLPLHDTFEIQLAGRYDHYSDFGSTFNPKVGLGWRPWDDVLLRATWGTSFRPPTFRELYDPRLEGLSYIPYDPWRCPATGDFFDCFGNLMTGVYSGNPDLEPDEGETWLLGFAWEPAAFTGLSLAADAWRVEHDNRIDTSADFVLNAILLENLDPFTNPFTVRAPQTPEDIALGIPGVITSTFDTYFNGVRLVASGIDAEAVYAWDTQRAGLFELGVNYAYLDEWDLGLNFREAVISDDFAGGYGFDSGLPQHRANLRFEWRRGAHNLAVFIPWTGEYDSGLPLHVDGVPTERPFTIDDWYQLDLQYSVEFSGLNGARLRLGCRNCTDRDPPVYNMQADTDAFHEGRGAMVYVRWTQPFLD